MRENVYKIEKGDLESREMRYVTEQQMEEIWKEILISNTQNSISITHSIKYPYFPHYVHLSLELGRWCRTSSLGCWE